ncbi:MAG: hypothetical protein ACREP9_16815, partial [Candidatus Dormibacteraceae bacterium]
VERLRSFCIGSAPAGSRCPRAVQAARDVMRMGERSKFRVGKLVEVRSEAEILRTLDARGMLEGTPFMAEMLQYCGKQFRVGKVAHKTCDTMYYTGLRRVKAAVHLEGLRCDGSAHGGCDADCLLFWKDAWLKRVGEKRRKGRDLREIEPTTVDNSAPPGRERLYAGTRHESEDRYVCQVTELLNMSRPWAWWNPVQYLEDIRSGNFSISHVYRTLILAALRQLIPRYPNHPMLVGIYDRLARRTRIRRYFSREQLSGPIQPGSPTPGGGPDLKAGDWVRIRPAKEIISTLANARNKGLSFDTEMYPYCGGTYRVRGLVRRLIEEPTGRMMEVKTPCVKLEGVVCKSEYSERRYMCPREIMPFWRPLWLEKVESVEEGPLRPSTDRHE